MVVITRSRGGTAERQVDVQDTQIPDLYHIGQWLNEHQPKMRMWIRDEIEGGTKSVPVGDAILECWQLCHDLRNHILEGDAR